MKALTKTKYNKNKNIILKWALGFFTLYSAEHYVAELWMLKLALKRIMPKRTGEDQFVSKMGSLHRIAMMELFV